MKTREDVLFEIELLMLDFKRYKRLFSEGGFSYETFTMAKSDVLTKVNCLMWCLGVDTSTLSLNFDRIEQKALALLDNANITPSC